MRLWAICPCIFLAVLCAAILPRLNTAYCLYAAEPEQAVAQKGGLYKPSQTAPGEYMRALIVFAQFKDDQSSISNWKKGSLPDWAGNLIDDKVSSSYRSLTISDYFRKMSVGRFDFIGDTYPEVITLEGDMHYRNANQLVIESLNKKRIDFKRYDNWLFDGKRHVFSEAKGDGYFDMMIIIYRNGPGNFGLKGGIAELGLANEFITHDGIRISGYALNVHGSGITSNNRGAYKTGFDMAIHIAHEYGHYMFGGGHIRLGGLMAGDPYDYYGDTKAMSAWERERLGYISIPVADKNGYTRTLKDYVSDGDAVRINIPFHSDSPDEYLIIENHQRISPYDQIIRGGGIQGALDPDSKVGRGIYVWYIQGGRNFPPRIKSLQADGLWKWQFDGWKDMPEGWPKKLALIRKQQTDRNMDSGLGDREPDILNYEGRNWHRWHDYNESTGKWELTREVMGDETDAFNIDYNRYITPWSNPGTSKKNGPTNISIALISQAGTQITVRIFSTASSAAALPPARPQNLRTEKDPADKGVKLIWEANLEPDIMLYEISRTTKDGWRVIGTTKNNYFTDKQYSSVSGSGREMAQYRIRALDSQKQYSNYSDEIARSVFRR